MPLRRHINITQQYTLHSAASLLEQNPLISLAKSLRRARALEYGIIVELVELVERLGHGGQLLAIVSAKCVVEDGVMMKVDSQ